MPVYILDRILPKYYNNIYTQFRQSTRKEPPLDVGIRQLIKTFRPETNLMPLQNFAVCGRQLITGKIISYEAFEREDVTDQNQDATVQFY